VTLRPKKERSFNAAVTALDAVRVLQYSAGLLNFDGTQRLAADVTGNGTVSALDAARILQFQAGLLGRCGTTKIITCATAANCPPGETCEQHFAAADACGSDWMFVPIVTPATGQTVIQPEINAGTCQPGAITYAPTVVPQTDQDFVGILLGDTTGNWVP
jgi:hypothetical protein